MQLVLFKDLLEDDAEPQYGLLGDGDKPNVICLCCGGIIDFEDYEILEKHTWKDISSAIKLIEKNKYVVCMDETFVRDAQYLDTKNLSRYEFDTFDYYDSNNDDLWRDMEPSPFIAIIEAESEDEACQKAAEQKRYDSRCLYAIKI